MAQSSSRLTRPAKLSSVTHCISPSETKEVMSSKVWRTAVGCFIVDLISEKTMPHSVCDLKRVYMSNIYMDVWFLLDDISVGFYEGC